MRTRNGTISLGLVPLPCREGLGEGRNHQCLSLLPNLSPKVRGFLSQSLVLLALFWSVFSFAQPARADVTIDPNSAGATDVIQDPNGTPVLLVNPLPDPLDLGSDSLAVGNTADGALAIENGGSVSNRNGYIAYDPHSTGMVTVTGTGSQWNNSYLYVGHEGNGTLTVEAGGLVNNSYHGFLGFDSGSTGVATVTGAGSQWNNSSSLYVGRDGSGTLTVEAGGQVSNSLGCLGYYSGSTGTATVTGAGSQWNSISLSVGRDGSGTLTVEAGGQVNNTVGYLGSNSGSTGAATVTGAGSQWNNSSVLYVGYEGSGTLTVEDGGEVTAGTLWASLSDIHGDGTITVNKGAVLDADLVFDASHGTQAITSFGSGGTLTVTAAGGELGVGYKGLGSLTVADGIAISNLYGYLGYNSGSTGTATVSGAGSQWNNSSDLYIGRYGIGTLTVEAGGQVSNTYGYLGRYSGSTGVATVTGAGSQWNNSYLYVGREGSGMLTVEAGGLVSSTYGYLGYDSGSTGTVTVTGTGSQWNNSSALNVGGINGSGTLTVEAGGLVSNTEAFLGYYSVSTGTATVTGTGSQWNSSSSLIVGRDGNGTLTVEAGGQVSSAGGSLGARSTGSTGTATVTGAGSQWNSSSSLIVGSGGSGTLTVEAGGVVSNFYEGYLGYNWGSTGAATVTGAGSQWNNSSELHVGIKGSGTLTVEAGGQVSSAGGYLGYNWGSTGAATVTGAGSQWNNAYSLSVGISGSGTLTVEAGGVVSNFYEGYLGYNWGSTGAATVTGAGSQWNNSYLYVGREGSGTLNITDGGLVSVDGNLTIDDDRNGDSFIYMATGGMLALASDEYGDDSLGDFLDLINGTDAINYWDIGLSDWTNITSATYGDDYTLEYLTTGDLAGYTVLTVLTPEPGADFDIDGDIDGADFLAWQRGESPMPLSDFDLNAWKESFHALSGDYDADGDTDGADFLAWQRGESPNPLSAEDLALWQGHFGSGTGAPSTTTVPEPTTLVLAVLGMLAVVRLRV